MFAPLIAVVVSLLKRIGFVRNNPKIVALVLSMVAPAWHIFHPGAGPIDVAAVSQCILAQFAGAVATYEVAIQPVRNAVTAGLTGGGA